MKSIRIASTIKHVEGAGNIVILFKILEILSEHRSVLIMRILIDLATYLQFKFNSKVEKIQHESLKNKLVELSSSQIGLDRYNSLVEEIKKNENYRVPTQPFLNEISAVLYGQLNPLQLQLVK